MKPLLILGIWSHSLELAEIVARINRNEPTWELLGFVAPDNTFTEKQLGGLPVLGGPEVIAAYSEAWLIPDYGWPGRRNLPRERLAALLDPSVFLSPTAVIGAGTIIYPNCFVGARVTIGELLFCLSGCALNHDDVIEDHVALATGVTLAGEVHVETGCYLGQSCTIRQQLRIGHDSLIGMGAVVIADVPPESVMVGNPARRLRSVREPA